MDKNQNLSLYKKKDKMPISNVLIEPQMKRKKNSLELLSYTRFISLS